MDMAASKLLPNPAVLKLRLSKTGKDWTPAHYLMASVGIAAAIALLAFMKGAPLTLAALVGAAVGLAIPHMA
ncbi:hypothetical protein, partial [Enterococcus faecium]|uniref:hypothetical protein n=1 Tax=Enterococcus faecium TaxID=1352 RepID=UPI003F431728